MKRVKQLIDDGAYREAAEAIEALQNENEDAHNFGMTYTLGQAYSKIEGKSKQAISAFESALNYDPAPPPAFWKAYSEALDKESRFEESGDALSRQYELVKSKANYSKAIEVCRLCLDRWGKITKKNLEKIQKVAEFLHQFLQESWLAEALASAVGHLEFIVQLLSLQYQAYDIRVEAAKSKLSSKSVESAEKPEVLDPMSFAVKVAIELILSPDNQLELGHLIENKTLHRGISEWLQARRSHLLTLASSSSSSEEVHAGFQELFAVALNLGRTSDSFLIGPIGAGSYAFEAWLLLSNSESQHHLEKVVSLADKCLGMEEREHDEKSAEVSGVIGAHLVKAIAIAKSGLLSKTRPHLPALCSYWSSLSPKRGGALDYHEYRAKSAADRTYAFYEWTTYVLAIAGALGGAERYLKEVLPMSTYLALTQQARDWMLQSGGGGSSATSGALASSGPMDHWVEAVCLCRVHALLSVRQGAAARAEALQCLPLYFSPGAPDDSINQGEEEDVQAPAEASNIRKDALWALCGVGGGAVAGACLLHRLVLHALLGMGLFTEARDLAEALHEAWPTAAGESPPSYLLSEGAFASVCQAVNAHQSSSSSPSSSSSSYIMGGLAQAEAGILSVDLSTLDAVAPASSTGLVAVEKASAALSLALGSKDAFCGEIAADLHYRIGLCSWLQGGRVRADKKCVSALLSSAKLAPSNGATYTLLGHHYHTVGKDRARAVKCYLKALQCSPLEEEAGLALSLLWIDDLDSARAKPAVTSIGTASGSGAGSGADSMGMGVAEEKKLLKLWADAIKLTTMAAWVFEVRGRYHLQQGMLSLVEGPGAGAGAGAEGEAKHEDEQQNRHLEAAADDLQRALELRAGSAQTWCLLGIAQLHLRRFGSATAALSRAHRLDPSSALPLALEGRCALRLGLTREARSLFSQALQRDKQDMLSLGGAAEAQLLSARQSLAWGWATGAAAAIDEGLEYLHMALAAGAGEGFLSLWKLKADLCALTVRVDPRDLTLRHLPSSRCHSDPESKRNAALEEGEQLYRKIVARLRGASEGPQAGAGAGADGVLARAWSDLGGCLYSRLQMRLRAGGVTAGLCTKQHLLQSNPELQQLNEDALHCFLEGLKADANCADCWAGAGLCHGNDEVACACLVRATQLDPAHAPAQLSLALRFAANGHLALAEEALRRVQMVSSDPGAWTALGLLQERQSLSLHSMSAEGAAEALRQAHDAYRVAVEVTKPAEARLGLAVSFLRLVGVISADEDGCDTLCAHGAWHSLDGVQLKFVADHLTAYVQEESGHPVAWCLLGWAQESQGGNRAVEAAHSYRSALIALETVLAGLQGGSGCASGIEQRVLTIAETAAGRLAYLTLRASSAVGTLSVDEAPIPVLTLSSCPHVAALTPSLAQACAFMDTPDAAVVSSVPSACPLYLAGALQAWSLGDISVCSAALHVACLPSQGEGEGEGPTLAARRLLGALSLLQELSCSMNQQRSQQLVDSCGEWLSELLLPLCQAPLGPAADLEMVLQAASSASAAYGPLVTSLLGARATLDPLVWVLACVQQKPLCKQLHLTLLRLALSRWPYSAALFVRLAKAGGGAVGVEVTTLLLSRGLLSEERADAPTDAVSDSCVSVSVQWSAQRCAEQAVHLGNHCLVAPCTQSTSESDPHLALASSSAWNQSWVQRPLLSPSEENSPGGNAETPSTALCEALLMLDAGSPLRSRAALLRAAHLCPWAMAPCLEEEAGGG